MLPLFFSFCSHSAAANFKLVVSQSWSRRGKANGAANATFQLSEPVKELIKAKIVPATIDCSVRVRKLLAEALKIVADQEWPDKWPKLIESLMPMLAFSNFAEESHRVVGAAQCIRVVLRRYQYLTVDVENRKRWPIHRMAQIIMGPYLQMIQQLIPIQSQASIELQIMLVKTFWSCIQEEVPPVIYNSPQLIRPWMETLVRIMITPIPDSMQPQDLEMRPQFCWWVLKKWCAKILYRVHRSHGVPSDVVQPPMEPSDDVIAYEQGSITPKAWSAYRKSMAAKKQFAIYFEQELGTPIYVEMLKMLTLITKNIYVSPRVQVNLLMHCCFSVRQAQLWKVLEPQVDAFLANVIFRIIVMSPEERRTFYEDPLEFVNLTTELTKLVYSPRLQAMYLLRDVMKLRKKDHLHRFMDFLGQRLQTKVSAEEKEAILSALGSVSEELLDNPKYAPQLEGLMTAHVFPEVQGGPNGGPVEWRALWLLGRFWTIRWKNWDGILEASRRTVQCLSSPLIPIRLQAAEVIPHLVHLPPVAEAVESILPHVVEKMVLLSQKIDSEEVMTALQSLVEKYPTKMAPLTLQLIPPILKSFHRAVQEEGEKSAMAAFSSLELVVSLVDGSADHTHDPVVWQRLEAMLTPCVLELLRSDAMSGLWEMGLKLLCALTYKPPFPNGPELWATLPMLFAAWQEWAKDYMLETAEAWDNFFTNSPEQCAANGDILKAANEMIAYALRPDADLEEREGGLKLLQSVLANMRGRVDAQLGPWMGMLFAAVKHESEAQNLESVMDLTSQTLLFLWYNPVAALQLLEQNNMTSMLLNAVFTQAEDYETKKQLKLSILGLSTLLHVPPQALPMSVKQQMPKICHILISMQMELWERKDEEEKYKRAEEESMTGFDDDADLYPNQENIADDFDVGGNLGGIVDFDGENVVDLDFGDGFEGMRAMDEGDDLCHTLDEFDEISFWAEGTISLSKSSPEFLAIMNGLGKKEMEKVQKLMLVHEEAKKKNAIEGKK